MRGPVSIGADECEVFATIISHFQPKHCFMIGNGFGLSSAFIALAMEAHNGQSVITLDNCQEGNGARCFQTAEQLRQRLACRFLKHKLGVSPQDIAQVVEANAYDLVFIDGDHSHPQASRDFDGVRALVPHSGIIVWHDYWLRGVAESVAAAQQAGYHCLQIPSSSEMVLGTRDDAVLSQLQSLFPAAVPPAPFRYLPPRIVFLRATLKSLLAR